MRAPHEVLGIPQDSSRTEIRKAYRGLARRWHPDRFMKGPEREWASDKMSEINSAYRLMIRSVGSDEGENIKLTRAKQLINDGKLSLARELLMTLPTRCAEWNYLFGTLLMKLADYKKALIYLSVAAHQTPNSSVYSSAEVKARAAIGKKRILFK